MARARHQLESEQSGWQVVEGEPVTASWLMAPGRVGNAVGSKCNLEQM